MQEGKNRILMQAILFVVIFAVAFFATRYFLRK